MNTPFTSTRPSLDVMWERLLIEVRVWLDAHPHASCQDAARHFGINGGTLNARLNGAYDFKARRRARGESKRAEADAKREVKQAKRAVKLVSDPRALLDTLARIERMQEAILSVVQRLDVPHPAFAPRDFE